jgi:Rrf2 family iron-sulfur cluster assembly transcriptional regulator
MKLSTKARYAVTAMMDLALHEKARPVTLADISHYQGISLSYLEQLFAKLRKEGLVSGVRGPGGGYRLARPSSEISIAEVVAAINGDEEHVFKGEAPDEPNNDREMLEVMWSDLSGKIHEFLDHITLDEFVRARTEGISAEGDTSIQYGETRHERSEAA